MSAPAKPGRGRRVVLALLAAASLAGAGLAGRLFYLTSPADPAAPERIFVVSPGSSLGQVARALEEQGVVRSHRVLAFLGRYRGLDRHLRSGEYELSPAMSPFEILAMFAEGRVKTYEVVLPEGITSAEIARRLAAQGLVDPNAFLAFTRDPGSAEALGVEGPGLEGYLFPDTYRLPRGLSPREIARTLVARFQQVWDTLAPEAAERGVSQREVVTIASIVEKETALPAERPRVASVYWNRLARHMRLEADPTVIYGIPNFDGNLRRADLENEHNPYNTYRIAGLPPGPIANPGEASLRAAVEPEQTDYLFFVSRNDGSHVFTRRYEDHAREVNRLQKGRSR
jgi:UPF0755 protein